LTCPKTADTGAHDNAPAYAVKLYGYLKVGAKMKKRKKKKATLLVSYDKNDIWRTKSDVTKLSESAIAKIKLQIRRGIIGEKFGELRFKIEEGEPPKRSPAWYRDI